MEIKRNEKAAVWYKVDRREEEEEEEEEVEKGKPTEPTKKAKGKANGEGKEEGDPHNKNQQSRRAPIRT